MRGRSLRKVSLQPLAWGFGALTGLRNRCFDWNIAAECGAGVPVISVGNLVAGGTGKTPFVEYLANLLIHRVGRVAMVSRGYGRRSRGVVTVSAGEGRVVSADVGGDEPVQVALKFPSLVVVVGEDRVAAASRAVKELHAEVIIVDDGFQHRSLRRDCNILLLDARKDITREAMLPAGYRREPLRGMQRADLVVFTRVDSPSGTVPWESVLRRWYRGPMTASRIVPEGFYRASDRTRTETVEGKTCFAFSGIADHARFVAGLRGLGMAVVGEKGYPDHHRYSDDDIEHLTREFQKSAAEVLITTEKDVMRLMADEGLKQRTCIALPLAYVQVGLKVIRGEDTIVQMIDHALSRSAA